MNLQEKINNYLNEKVYKMDIEVSLRDAKKFQQIVNDDRVLKKSLKPTSSNTYVYKSKSLDDIEEMMIEIDDIRDNFKLEIWTKENF